MDIYVSSMEQIAPEYHLSSRRVIDVNYHPGSGYTIPAGSIFILPKDPVGWFDYTPNDKYVVNLVDVFINEYGELCSAYDTSKTIPVPYDFDNTNEDIDCWDPAGAPVKGYIDFSTDSMAIPSLPTGVKSGYHYLCESIPYRMVFNGLLSDYVSLIWNDSFDDVGTFTLTCLDTPENRKLFVTNRYVRISKSGETMIIEKVVTNAALKNDGYLMTISGRSLSSILDRRVAFPGIGLNTDICQKQGGIVYGINHLVKAYFIDPSIPVAKETISGQDSFYYPKRKVPCFMIDNDNEDGTIPPNADEFPRGTPMGSVNRTVSKKDILSAVKELCQNNNLGFHVYQKDHELKNRTTGKVVFTHTVFHFAVYQGEKRTYGSGKPMIFSPMFDNVDSLSVTDDITNHKNFVFCGKEKDSDTYIDMSASGESTTSQSAISELMGSVKIISTMKNWLQTQLQDNTVTRTGVLFLAIAASRKDASYDPTVNTIICNATGSPEREKDTDGNYIYPADYDDYGYTITYKKVVGASDASASGKVGTFQTSDHNGVSWVEDFKMSTAFGWLTSDIIKEATQALNNLGDGFINTAKGLAIKAWFRGLDQYTSNYATIRWLCATHDTGDPLGDGLNRREVFVDEEAEEDDDWNEAAIHNWRNSTTLVTENQDGEETDEEILQRLKTSAVKQSGEYRKRHDIDIKCNGDTSIYRRDYFLGDVIQADDTRGNLETYVVKAVAITNDVQSGEQIVPTFDKYSVIPKDYTRLEWLQLCNMVLPVQYNPDSAEDQDSESLKTTETNLPWGSNKGVESYSAGLKNETHVERGVPFTSIKDRRFKLTSIKTKIAKRFSDDETKDICKESRDHLAAAISVDGCEVNNENNNTKSCSRDFPMNLFMTYGYSDLNQTDESDDDNVMRDANSYSKTYEINGVTRKVENGRLVQRHQEFPTSRKRGWFMTSNSNNVAQSLADTTIGSKDVTQADSTSYLPGFSYPVGHVNEAVNDSLYQIHHQSTEVGHAANNGKFDEVSINVLDDDTIKTMVRFNNSTVDNVLHWSRNNKVKIEFPYLYILAKRYPIMYFGDSDSSHTFDYGSDRRVFLNGRISNNDQTDYNRSYYGGVFTDIQTLIKKAIDAYNDERKAVILKYSGEESDVYVGAYIPQPRTLNGPNHLIKSRYGANDSTELAARIEWIQNHDMYQYAAIQNTTKTPTSEGQPIDVPGDTQQLQPGNWLIVTPIDAGVAIVANNVPEFNVSSSQSVNANGEHRISMFDGAYTLKNGDFVVVKFTHATTVGDDTYNIIIDRAELFWSGYEGEYSVAVLNETVLRRLFTDENWVHESDRAGGNKLMCSTTLPKQMYQYKNKHGKTSDLNYEYTNEAYVWKQNYIHGGRGFNNEGVINAVQETKPYGTYLPPAKAELPNPPTDPQQPYSQSHYDSFFEYFPRYIILGGYRYRRYSQDAYNKRSNQGYKFDPDFTDNENGYAYQQIEISETNAVDRTYSVCDTEIYDGYLESWKTDKENSEIELKAQLFDTNSTRVTHVLTPVVYKGGDGDDFAKLTNEQKYGFYDETVGMFIPINYDTDGGTNPDAKFIAAGPELVE